MSGYRILVGDVMDRLRELPDASVQCVVTSPPYWGLRDYGVAGQIGMEPTMGEYLAKMVEVFREVRRALRADGTCWINMGDAYAGSWGSQGHFVDGKIAARSSVGWDRAKAASLRKTSGTGSPHRTPGLKPKDLMGMPWRLAFALQEDGWWLRQDIIWSKPNPMPESVTDRCTKAHEYLFLLTKSARYYYDADAIRTPFRPETKALSFETMDFGRRDEYAGPRVPGNLSHKGVTAYEEGDARHRTKQGLIAYAERCRDAASSHRGSSFTQGKTAATKPTVGQGARADNTLGANKRSVWDIATEPDSESHFATFPTKLVEPCILAGTSERGCCVYCGAASVRQVVATGGTIGEGWHDHAEDLTRGARGGTSAAAYLSYKRESTGWALPCPCLGPEERDDDNYLSPCEVLDPFSGSGTVGVVALRYGRSYTGIELNPTYAAMSINRIVDDAPLLRQQEVPT